MYGLNSHAQENPNEQGILQKHRQINIDAKQYFHSPDFLADIINSQY